jgi:hypothetical protein
MPTPEEQRRALGELAARALDEIDQIEGDAALGDAVLVYEIKIPDGSRVQSDSIAKSPPMAVGLLTLALKNMTTPTEDDEESGEP